MVLVDAARGGVPGSVERVPVEAAGGVGARSTHGLGLAEALDVASALGILPAEVCVYAVHGRTFDLGPVTPEVAASIDTAAELIRRDELGRTVSGPRPPCSG